MSSFTEFVTLVFVVISCASLVQGEENILLKKKVFANDYEYYQPNTNDGNIRSCLTLRSKPIVYVGIDIGAEYEIDKVVIKNRWNRGNATFSVALVNNILKCGLLPNLAKFPVCSNSEVQKTDTNEVSCNGKKARYVVIYRGAFDNKVNVDPFSFCEIEAYGKKTGKTGSIPKPEIKSEHVPKVSKSYFKHLSALRKNSPQAVVTGYSRGFVKLNKNCEPFIWDAKDNLIFALACSSNNGKTRALLFAYDWYFYYATNNGYNKEMGTDFMKWLSPNKPNATIHMTKHIELADLRKIVKEGDIVDFFTYKSYSQEYYDQIIEWHDKGFIGLVMDHQRRPEFDLNVAANKILDHFNVVFDDTYFLFGGTKKYPMDDFHDLLMDPEDVLEKMAKDHDFLLNNFKLFGELLNKIPPSLEKNAKNFGSKVYKVVAKYDKLLRVICPCKDDPPADKSEQGLLAMIGNLAMRQSIAHKNYKLPCIQYFPGDFKKPPTKISRTVEVFGEIKYTRNPTGLYIPAGASVEYRVLQKTGSWLFDIGCQTDSLVGKRPTYYRYPVVTTRNIKVYDSGVIHSPFGGVLWIVNVVANTSMKLEIKNVVQSPFFNIQDGNKAVKEWDSYMRTKAEGPWGILAGQDFIMCGATVELAKYTGSQMKYIVEMWDKIVRSNYAIAGENWREYRPETVVIDIQTSAGSGHSGYPVVVWDNWYPGIINRTYIMQSGSWGMCHELGHNRQRSVWNFKGVGESTNNVFCLYQYGHVWGLEYYGKTKEGVKSGDIKSLEDFFNGGAKYSVWSASFELTLFTYTQLMNQFGFHVWNEALKYYQNNKEEMKSVSSLEDKRDKWMEVTSRVTKMNLGPFYAFWGWPVSEAQFKRFSKFGPCFIAQDYFMDLSASWKKSILAKYPSCTHKPSFFKEFVAGPLIQGNRPNFIKFIK